MLRTQQERNDEQRTTRSASVMSDSAASISDTFCASGESGGRGPRCASIENHTSRHLWNLLYALTYGERELAEAVLIVLEQLGRHARERPANGEGTRVESALHRTPRSSAGRVQWMLPAEPAESSAPLLERIDALHLSSPPSFSYVNEDAVSEHLICELCYHPFCDPVVHIPCGNTFCRSCISGLKSCPKKCGIFTDESLSKPTRVVLNLLDDLLVKCPVCNGTVKRAQLPAHISECQKSADCASVASLALTFSETERKDDEPPKDVQQPEAAPEKGGLTRTHKIIIGATAVAVVGAVALPLAIPAAVGALGFGSGGIVAGSWAASFMASYGGAVSAGSACAVLQSIGAAGLAGTGIATAAAGGAAAGAATGGVIAVVATSGSKGANEDTTAKAALPPSPEGNALVLCPQSVYAFSVRHLLDGCDRSLDQFAGRLLLIVNIASESRMAASQLAGLQRLYQKYLPSGFLVLGFPCDQWNDEPGSDLQMAEVRPSSCTCNHRLLTCFCCPQTYLRKYNVTFPIFTKTLVNGAHSHPLFTYLRAAAKGPLGLEFIMWNYTKFLVGRDGKPVCRFGPTQTADDIEASIAALCRP